MIIERLPQRLLLLACLLTPYQPVRVQAECVQRDVCDTIETPGDDIDQDGDGVELQWVYLDSTSDSTYGPGNELVALAAGWSDTLLVLGFDFTLENNAMVWLLELEKEGGVDSFISPASGGTYEGMYPTAMVTSEGMDLMVATHGTFPLAVYALSDSDSDDITNEVPTSCLLPNCNDGTRAFGYVRIRWQTLYPEPGGIPAGLRIRIAGIVRGDNDTLPADTLPDVPVGEEDTPLLIDSYVALTIDSDGDSIPDQGFFQDADGDGFSMLSGDCDDTSPAIHPLADEECNGVDDDCDGTIPQAEIDADGDGFAPCQADCDDTTPGANPDQLEVCDGLDNDCDGLVDEGFDLDGIGGPDCSDEDGDGLSEALGDCNDEDPAWYPGGEDWCDGLDNNCNGLIDEGFDLDQDGTSDCIDDDGDAYSELQGDCNDADPGVNPARPEVCDGVDNDCDGFVDEGFDQDGLGGPDCLDNDGDGVTEQEGDCNDESLQVRPGRPEQCDGIDNNCNAEIDEGFDQDGIGGSDCSDNDGDGFTEFEGDCNDADATIHPGVVEQCDGVDNDCDGQTDERFDADGSGGVDCVDNDGDGFTELEGDCEDEDPGRYPGAEEVCDGVDNDCNGRVDDPFDLDADGTSDCVDDDWDGYTEQEGDCDDLNANASPGNEEVGGNGVDENCDGLAWDEDGDGFGPAEGDCDDTDRHVSPAEVDVCDGVDNDCDGQVDEGEAEVCFDGVDNDCDGFVDEGHPEVCNGRDDDCDGQVDEGVREVGGDGVCVTRPGFACNLAPGDQGHPAGLTWVLFGLPFAGMGALRRRSRDPRPFRRA